MKASKYIFVLPYDEFRTIVFSGLTHKFLVLIQDLLESVIMILRNPDEYKETHSGMIAVLKDGGYLIEDEENEVESLFNGRKEYVEAKQYKTTVLPTFDCNYNCWYCIQKHSKEKVDYSKIELIIKHVKTYLIENQIQSYVLSWFGGEPLIESAVIDYVSKTLRRFCIDNNIEFTGTITTNGALLTKDVIDMLERDRIDFYQITIDGDKENHNKTKHQEGEESSFDTILNNIVELLHRNERAQVALRFNYTAKSLKSETLVDDVNSIIPEELRHRLSVDFHKVWQIDEMSISIKDLAAMLKRFYDSGYGINSDHVFSICYVDKVHHNTIYFNGGVDKCDNHGIDKLRGHLDDDGHIVWKEKPIINDVNPLDEGNCCRECKYYPLCYACCPVSREERILKHGKMTCNYEGHFEIFEHRMLDFCVRQMIKNNLML